MGLDMYLKASKYVSNYNFTEADSKAEFAAIVDAVKLNDIVSEDSTSLTISVTVGYWRKANAIHNWFVKNCQGGVDECQVSDVDEMKLRELLAICKHIMTTVVWGEPIEHEATDVPWKQPAWTERVLASVDDAFILENLPPTEGFFFGSTDINGFFIDDIEETIKIIERVLPFAEAPFNLSFEYRSSW